MRILSIDVGIVNIGYAIFEIAENDITYLSSGYLCTKHKSQTKERLAIIYDYFADIIKNTEIKTLIYEQPIFNRGASGANVVKAEGILLLLAGINNLDCYSYTPSCIKKALTKLGKADKKDVENGVNKFLNLQLTFKTDHESDACAIGITHFLKTSEVIE
jgi:crossover junction endodeoxyribonuclease RuvC